MPGSACSLSVLSFNSPGYPSNYMCLQARGLEPAGLMLRCTLMLRSRWLTLLASISSCPREEISSSISFEK